MEIFQGLGKTFMLPVALLAFMGLFLGIGSSFSSSSTIDVFPFLGAPWLQVVFVSCLRSVGLPLVTYPSCLRWRFL